MHILESLLLSSLTLHAGSWRSLVPEIQPNSAPDLKPMMYPSVPSSPSPSHSMSTERRATSVYHFPLPWLFVPLSFFDFDFENKPNFFAFGSFSWQLPSTERGPLGILTQLERNAVQRNPNVGIKWEAYVVCLPVLQGLNFQSGTVPVCWTQVMYPADDLMRLL